MSFEKARRKKLRESEWLKLEEEQRLSGKTISSFCKERGLASSSYSGWKNRFSKSLSLKAETPIVKFKELINQDKISEEVVVVRDYLLFELNIGLKFLIRISKR